VTSADAAARAAAAHSIGRPQIPREAAAGPDLGPFFEEYLVPGAKAFVARRWPSAEEAVDLIHAAGGKAVVAHPYWDVPEADRVRDLVESLVRDVGLEGIETFYPSHTKAQTQHCLDLCEEFGLAPTGSSDFHGPTHKTFSRFGAYDTYGLGEPQVPPRA
jgi:predicted metal-dependent phosphoesterase TrpH